MLVRQPGLSAIGELVGEPPHRPRRGPKRKKLVERREDIPAGAFPDYWCEVLPHLRQSYGHLCAYLAMRIHPATGMGTVDHFIPKSAAWDKVYEWSNYRLSCALVNTCKGSTILPLDPFTLPDGLCALEFVAFQVKPGSTAAGAMEAVVDHMINDVLHLNDRLCCELRRTYFDDYMSGDLSLAILERDAPFIAMELRRQGMLRPGDS